MKVWRFRIVDDEVHMGARRRPRISRRGCNEPFKGRYWCPKRGWFRSEPCPFSSKNECETFEAMCGSL